MKGNNGSPGANFPLGNCEGDCDNDGECAAGLVCQARSGDEEVSGCSGQRTSGEDYCRYPNTLVDVVNPGRLLRNCEGDCETDADCDASLNLECFQRPGTETQVVTGCIGAGTGGNDYCAFRPSANYPFLKGNNGLPVVNFPLGLCEGVSKTCGYA